jgi:hypothetical protein
LISVFSGFEPIRIGVQGEVIRDLDAPNMMNSQSRKAGLGDSDDEESAAQSTGIDRSNMDIYRQRQQKRVKLTTTTSDQSTPPPVLT